VAEFIGTFALVFFITLTVSLYVTPPINGVQPFIDFSVIGLVHFLLLFMLVQTLALVSGAHFNPAVTLALFAIRQIRAADAAIYWLCQLAGAVAAALATKAASAPRRSARSSSCGRSWAWRSTRGRWRAGPAS
jgi:glycerol uptake facilitator-like aquaporin